MARTSPDVRLQDRTARSRLAISREPYWRQLSQGVFLGYRRGVNKGSWVARFQPAGHSGNVRRVIGEADDRRDADGRDILNWRQAFDRTLGWIEHQSNSPETACNADITVADAAAAQIAVRDARKALHTGRSVHSDAYYKLTKHVVGDKRLAGTRLADLTEADLRAWQLRLARSKPASIQRIVNELKAALNAAHEAHRRLLPADLPITIKYGLKLDTADGLIAVARENQILTDDQVRRVIAAAIAIDADFGRMVVLLAATGARFIQLARMCVGDVQPDQLRVMVPQSYKGRKRQRQYVRVAIGQDTLSSLHPILADRPASAPLLERWRMRQVSAVVWEQEERGAWTTASELTRMWKRAVAESGLPATTIPYALRHSSIVRGLRLGLPIRLVAALHDTSVAMIERHYSRWITEGLDELAARAVVPLLADAA